MEIATLVLQYLQTLLSWPTITALLGFYFLRTFRDPLSDFMRRIVKGQGFGVSVEATSPLEQRREIKEKQETTPALPKDPNQEQFLKYVNDNPSAAFIELRKMFNGYYFERAYNLIYGSQLSLLEHLATKGEQGDSYINLYSYYRDFLTRSGLSTTQMADYLGFLRDAKFVEYIGNDPDLRVKIAPYGLDFLSYVKGQYPAYKHKPF